MDASIDLGLNSRTAAALAGRLALPLALSGIFFCLDLTAPDRMVFGLPYLAVVILAQSLGGTRAATVAAASSSLLVLAAPVFGNAPRPADPLWMVIFGRLTVVVAVGMMAALLKQRDEARATLRRHVDVVETRTTQRSDEMRLVNAQLHREIAERRRAELRSGYLASIVESSADAIIGQSLSGTIVSWNSGAVRVYGHAREDVIGRPVTVLLPPHREEEMASIVQRVAQGEKIEEVESVRLRSDATEFDVSATFSPILDERGTILGVSMIERDITRRMHAESALQSLNAELEEKVRQRTEELESAVGELEAFSYSVSHDLRAPLRALAGFAETLSGDLAGRIEGGERELLDRIRGAAGRMDRIIEDLLMLSRAGNHRIEKEVVNLGEVVRSVVEELRAAWPDRQVDWDIGNGLLAWGDPGLLRLVVQNLVGNAFKYSAGQPVAQITIGVEERAADAVTYFVRDNGIGFDPREAGQLFRPFSRLHSREQFEGTGIGLATVERIVRRHGGTVSAEGRVGEGATFRFRLPVPKRTRAVLGDDYDEFGDEAPPVAVGA